MSKRKAAEHCQILPWLSAKGDCREGRFLQLGNSLLLSAEFQTLSAEARQLYLAMALESGGKREFVFPLKSAKKYGFAETTFRRKVKELKEGGFIHVDSGHNLRLPNHYSFIFDWKNKPP